MTTLDYTNKLQGYVPKRIFDHPHVTVLILSSNDIFSQHQDVQLK